MCGGGGSRISARSPNNERCFVIVTWGLCALAEVHCGAATPSDRAARLSLPTDTVQNVSDVLFEGCRFGSRKSKVDKINLVLPSEAVERDSIWMCPQEPSNALLRYSAVLRFEPAVFLPTPNPSRCNTKKGCKTVSRKSRKPMNFVHTIVKARELRADRLHGVPRAERD